MHKPTALVITTTAALALAGCSSAAAPAPESDATTIVASTAIWADVASAVAPDAEVSAIVGDANVDPHSFEPAATDLARAADADLVVANGGGYDAWLYEAIEQDKIVHALPLIAHSHGEEDHSHEGHDHEAEIETVDGNEHIWYDTDAVTVVAEDIAAATGGDASALVEEMAALKQKIEALPALRVAQTETIGDYIIDDSAMTDVTPEGYRQTQLNHGEPAAADLAAFLDLIESGGVDLLIHNPQTQTDLTDQIRNAAEEAGVAVVELGETPPEGTDFLQHFNEIVDDISAATT